MSWFDRFNYIFVIMGNNGGKFKVIKPDFPLELKYLIQIKKFFSSILGGKGSHDNILLDLSNVNSIDSVGYKSINNLYSSLQKDNVGFVVYTEKKEYAEQFKKITPDLKVTDKIETGLGQHLVEINLECPVCHNTSFPRTAIKRDALRYAWREHSYLPHTVNPVTGEEIDIYREGLIVCNDCLLTSFYLTDFKQHDGGIEIPPSYSSDAKNLLIKSTNRRREILAKIGVEQSDYPEFVNKEDSIEYLYRLCADCISSTSFDRSINRFYEAGLANFLVYHFSGDKERSKDFLEKADVNFKDCIRFRADDDISKVWQSHYYRLVIAVLQGRHPQLLQIVEAFRKERNELHVDILIDSFDLWFRQAQKIHKQAINDVATKYSV